MKAPTPPAPRPKRISNLQDMLPMLKTLSPVESTLYAAGFCPKCEHYIRINRRSGVSGITLKVWSTITVEQGIENMKREIAEWEDQNDRWNDTGHARGCPWDGAIFL